MSTVQSPAGIVIPAFAVDANATKAPAVLTSNGCVPH